MAAIANDIRKEFEQAGFSVTTDSSGRLEVKKSGYVAFLAKQGGPWVYCLPPYFVARGLNCELEDHGYQKFWYAKAEGKRFPVRRVELANLHRFDQEVRYVLGVQSLYQQSLGSTNARTVYDRVEGRPDS